MSLQLAPPPTRAPTGGDEVDLPPPSLMNVFGPVAVVVSLLVGLFWMLARDHLVTGPAHRREIAEKDKQIADLKESHEQRVADKDAQIVMWRAVGETSQAQMAETLEHSRLSVQLLQAIERRAQEQAAAKAKRAPE
jgi:hypothetical protein